MRDSEMGTSKYTEGLSAIIDGGSRDENVLDQIQ
jgi:hypothetical protein